LERGKHFDLDFESIVAVWMPAQWHHISGKGKDFRKNYLFLGHTDTSDDTQKKSISFAKIHAD
jgi:hypothetical protein